MTARGGGNCACYAYLAEGGENESGLHRLAGTGSGMGAVAVVVAVVGAAHLDGISRRWREKTTT